MSFSFSLWLFFIFLYFLVRLYDLRVIYTNRMRMSSAFLLFFIRVLIVTIQTQAWHCAVKLCAIVLIIVWLPWLNRQQAISAFAWTAISKQLPKLFMKNLAWILVQPSMSLSANLFEREVSLLKSQKKLLIMKPSLLCLRQKGLQKKEHIPHKCTSHLYRTYSLIQACIWYYHTHIIQIMTICLHPWLSDHIIIP